VLNFPVLSEEIFGNLNLTLAPSWYALIFGSGLFGTTGNGGAVRNGIDLGDPSYIVALPAGTGWHDLSFSLPNHRFVIHGVVVPEPSTILLTAIVFSILLSGRTSVVWLVVPVHVRCISKVKGTSYASPA
jgi:hypothetical protein